MDVSDQSLLSDFLGGREQAFRELSERHMNLVYGVAMWNTADPSVAEEVVQDVFWWFFCQKFKPNEDTKVMQGSFFPNNVV